MNLMADILPFRPFYYNTKKAGALEKLISLPYDVISPRQREEYYAGSPYNITRLDFGKEHPSDDALNNKYTRAAKLFREWADERILVRQPMGSLYVIEQKFRHQGKMTARLGLLTLLKLEEFSAGGIVPH